MTDQRDKDQPKQDASTLMDAAEKLKKSAGLDGTLSFGTSASGGRVMLNGDIEIFPDRPLQECASFGTKAFEAQDRRRPGALLALLSPRHLQPRITSIGSYKNLKTPHALRMHEAGTIYWPPDDCQYFVTVYDMPSDRPLLQKDNTFFKVNEDKFFVSFLKPLALALAEFHAAEMVHGAVVPENIFMVGSLHSETPVLGECMSSAPFLRHSAAFETIERGMAQPSGRGPGSSKNDMYSLGMVVAMTVRGSNPFEGKADDEIIREKLENGSYGSVISRERMPTGLSEFLRGVLNDDEAHRWDIAQVQRWLEGRHAATRQAPIILKAARPFVFREEKMWDVRSVAYAFSKHTDDAMTVVEGDQFHLWIKRNFEDANLTERMEKEWAREEKSSPEKRVANMCLALDPQAPIRYKGLSLFPMGFGTALADSMSRHTGESDQVQAYSDIIILQYVTSWITQMIREILDGNNLIASFEKCRGYLTQKMPGYGIERVLYVLNKEAVCMSPLLKNYFVSSPAHILLALEDMIARERKPDQLIDRHMIAFISVREAKMIDPHLGHVISRDRAFHVVGVLRTYAMIQKRFNTGNVPAVGKWIIGMLAPAIDKFNDRDLRQEVKKRIENLPSPGDLQTILDLIDSTTATQDDSQKFILARQEFSKLLTEQGNIRNRLKKRREFGIETGVEVAMLTSAIIGTLGIMGYIIFYFMNR
jgi:serine/threonine protein kinase